MTFLTEVAADSPLYQWKMNGSSGDDVDAINSVHMFPGASTAAPTEGVTGAFTGSGTAWQFDGTNDVALAAATNSPAAGLAALGVSVITVEFWMWWNTFGNDDKLALELTDNFNTAGNNGLLVNPNSSNSTSFNGFDFGSGPGASGFWTDKFARPSAGAWHLYHLVIDRATPVNKAYVDGVSQTLTTISHTLATPGVFKTDRPLNVMCRSASGTPALFGAGKMQHLAIYGSELSAGRVLAHYQAAVPPAAAVSYGPLMARELALEIAGGHDAA